MSWVVLDQGGPLHVFMIWQLASPRARSPRERNESCNVIYDLIWEVTYYHFHHILSVARASPAHRRGLHKR